MRDPHIEWLEYEMQTDWLFESPPPLDWVTSLFKANLSNSLLRLELLDHFASVREARAAVESFLLAWEIDVGLIYGRRQMTFVFRNSHMVDRDPLPPESVAIAGMAATATGSASVSARGQVIRKTYPDLPVNFRAVPDVITLWNRFEGFKNGQEPLASMAYYHSPIPHGVAAVGF